MSWKSVVCLPFGLALGLSAHAAPRQAPLHDLEVIGTLQVVSEVGPSGHVVGHKGLQVFPNILERAYVIAPGQGELELPLLPGFERSLANDVDSAGTVVGLLAPLSGGLVDSQPALWTPQPGGGYSVQLLALPVGLDHGSANAINELGDIVGSGHTTSPLFGTAVLFSTSGTPTQILAPGLVGLGHVNDERIAIDNGQIPKFVDLDTLATQPLPPLPSVNGLPFVSAGVSAFTNNGRITGAAFLFTLDPCRGYAASLEPGSSWDLSTGCGTSNVATDVNEGGDRLEELGGVMHLVLDGQAPVALDSSIVSPPGTGPWSVDGFATGFIAEDRSVVCLARDLTAGVNRVVRLTPRVTCQADLGFGGPGGARLSACGGDLSLGTTAELALVGAPPSTPVYVGVSFTPNPTPFLGGIAVPYPPALVVPLASDATGVVRFGPLVGGIGPLTLYAQALYPDPSSPSFVGISNALRIDFLP
jgi:hypothetical protein